MCLRALEWVILVDALISAPLAHIRAQFLRTSPVCLERARNAKFTFGANGTIRFTVHLWETRGKSKGLMHECISNVLP